MRAINIPFTWIRNDYLYYLVPVSQPSNLHARVAVIHKKKVFQYYVRGKEYIAGKADTLKDAKQEIEKILTDTASMLGG